MCAEKFRFNTTATLESIPIMIISRSDEGMTICWRGCYKNIPVWALCPEKVQKVTRINNEESKFEVWETQSGPLAHIAKWYVGSKLDGMNQGIADCLKKYVEGKRI